MMKWIKSLSVEWASLILALLVAVLVKAGLVPFVPW